MLLNYCLVGEEVQVATRALRICRAQVLNRRSMQENQRSVMPDAAYPKPFVHRLNFAAA